MNVNNNLINSIKSIDFGQGYGDKGLVYEIARVHTTEELAPLLADIIKTFEKNEIVSIGDWGGGNGILAREIYNGLTDYNPIVTIIDLDDTKFIKSEHHRNIQADVLSYNPELRFDFSISRNVLHYLAPEQQERFMGNMFNNTRFGVLLINYTYDKSERNERRELEKILDKETGIERHYVTRDEMMTLVSSNGWKIKKDASYVIKNFDYRTWFKDRFGLDDRLIQSLSKTGLLRTIDYHTTVLYCKPS